MKNHIHTSLLDTDLYKFTMQQSVLHKHMGAIVEYHFRCRTDGVDLVAKQKFIEDEIDNLCSLSFQKDEIDYLGKLRYFKSDYVDFLEDFKLKRRYVEVKPSLEKPGSIDIIIKAPWVQGILFEVPILAIINEVYYADLNREELYVEGRSRLAAKIEKIKNHPGNEKLSFADFGTRRRFSKEWQYEVVKTLQKELPKQFTGTSNVWLAKEFGLTPIGTMAHEYLQAFQVLGDQNIYHFQKAAFESWVQEYRGDLGIVLTDVMGLDSFLSEFDLYFCKLFDGVRHDSGDPFEWGDRIIQHYEKHRIDPKTKYMTFSDGLNIDKMLHLYDYFKDRAKPNFGIGTDLTNDVGVKPLQVVLKMVRCNGMPVAKLSDASGKTMSDDTNFVDYLKHVKAFQTDN